MSLSGFSANVDAVRGIGTASEPERRNTNHKGFTAGTMVITKDDKLLSERMFMNPVKAMKLVNRTWMKKDHVVPIAFRYRNQTYVYEDFLADAGNEWIRERNWMHTLLDFRRVQMDDKPNYCRW